jgi:hypothetical protein
MDDELAKARRAKDEADGVDIYKYRRRFRLFKAILLGAALAGLTSLIMAMLDGKRNPCERVRDYLCKKDPAGLQCRSYDSIVDESVHESSAEMRSQIRSQCVSKIERLNDEEGVKVP